MRATVLRHCLPGRQYTCIRSSMSSSSASSRVRLPSIPPPPDDSAHAHSRQRPDQIGWRYCIKIKFHAKAISSPEAVWQAGISRQSMSAQTPKPGVIVPTCHACMKTCSCSQGMADNEAPFVLTVMYTGDFQIYLRMGEGTVY